jgi:hypothetical protein
LDPKVSTAYCMTRSAPPIKAKELGWRPSSTHLYRL